MIEILAGCAAGAAICLRAPAASARAGCLWMARHPAPTFVFADLVGYTALTERRGDDAGGAGRARVLARDVRRCAASTERVRSRRWATAR